MVTNPNVPNVLTPEQFIEQLRALMAQVGSVAPLAAPQREIVRRQARVPQAVVEASINVIGAADAVSQALGVPVADVHQMLDEVTRWTAAEGELKAALSGVAGANLIRRQRIALVSGQGYNIGRQLARDPGHAALVPHVDEVKRLRKLSRGKKRTPQAPSPSPAPAAETPKES
jgi:hypothetical protein